MNTPTPLVHNDPTIVDKIRKLIQTKQRLTAVTTELEELKRTESSLSDQILDDMTLGGMDTPPGVDGMTVYVRPTRYIKHLANPETGEKYSADDLHAALHAVGWSSLIKTSYNGTQLKSTILELVDNGQPIPDALAPMVEIETKRTIAVVPASIRKRAAAPTRT